MVGAVLAFPGANRNEHCECAERNCPQDDDSPHERAATTAPETAKAQTQAISVAAFPAA